MVWTAWLALLLGFGNFHPISPWALLHEAPFFKSQHVPMRWLNAWVMLSGMLALGAVERWIRIASWRLARPVIEVGLFALAAWVAVDIAKVSGRHLSHAFHAGPPQVTPAAEFHNEAHVPPSLQWDGAGWAAAGLPATMAGIGVIDCSTHPGLNGFGAKGPNGRAIGMGAWGVGDPQYAGEAYTSDRRGQAKITSFSPNRIVVEVSGATVGSVLILNQNWDPGWKANGERAIAWSDAVATRLESTEQRVEFRYSPRELPAGLALFSLTLGAIAAATWRSFRRRDRAKGRADARGADVPATPPAAALLPESAVDARTVDSHPQP